MEKNSKVIDGYEVKYSSEWIKHLESKSHWIYYWNQVRLINKYTSVNDGIVEIGIGTSFLCNYLKSKGRVVSTVDIDEDKSPDYVSSASEFDYKKVDANTVIAFEIFEHIPYSTFVKTIEKITKSDIRKIIFSVPKAQYAIFSLNLKLPKLPELNIRVSIPRRKIRTENHFWELSSIPRRKSSDNKLLIPEIFFLQLFEENSFSINRVEKVNNIIFYVAEKYGDSCDAR